MKDQLIDGAEAEHQRLRRIAFMAVAISTVAIFSSIITTPIIYSYLQTIQTRISDEVDYCRFKAKDMWVEVHALHDTMSENGSTRIRRNAAGAAAASASGASADGKTDQRQKRAWMFGKWMDTDAGAANSYNGGGSSGGGGSGGYGGVQPPLATSNGYEQPANSYQAPAPSSGGYDAPVLAPEPQIEQCKYSGVLKI